jgi:hypothetical protein
MKSGDLLRDPLSIATEAIPVWGAEEAVSKVSAALADAEASPGDVLLFILVFLAFYDDTYNLDLRGVFENLFSETKNVQRALRRALAKEEAMGGLIRD